METAAGMTANLLGNLGLEPTYEEWKPLAEAVGSVTAAGLEPTYEEWKLIKQHDTRPVMEAFGAYL